MKKVVVFTAVIFQSVVCAMGEYNAKLLDQYADTSLVRINLGIRDTDKAIEGRLAFLRGDESFGDLEQYEKEENFKVCIGKAKRFNSDKVFADFVSTCEAIFETASKRTKIAVHMLLNSVLQRYIEFQEKMQMRSQKRLQKKREYPYKYNNGLEQELKRGRVERESEKQL